ncbi:MAG: uracil-DNA glycosylase, partial [bacterium]|nr:uracil-DNA glycosylase [bacterium]
MVFALPEWVQQKAGKVKKLTAPPDGIPGKMALLKQELEGCMRCQLGSTRINMVFGEGNAEAGILVVGEGPGATEDETGRPFVGRSGKLLDKIFTSIDLNREKLFIANIVKCRPPNNRAPSSSESE